MPHFALTESSAFDLYQDGKYVQVFIPPYDMKNGYESLTELPCDGKMHDVIVLFPTCSEVAELEIGLKKGACLAKPRPYRSCAPVVFYGSSITQGGCASRAGNTYEEMISRNLKIDYVNLGFAAMAEVIGNRLGKMLRL